MGEFFRGGKRKLGMLTLVMACVFMAGWIRGTFICDLVDFGGQGGYVRLNASCYGLLWCWNEGDPEVNYGDAFQWEQHRAGSANGPQPATFHLGEEAQRDLQWYWCWAGFHFAKMVWLDDQMRITMWVIPYWSIVVPLIGVSGWLLLSKPRQSTEAPE